MNTSGGLLATLCFKVQHTAGTIYENWAIKSTEVGILKGQFTQTTKHILHTDSLYS